MPFSNFQANIITFEALGLLSESANNKTFNWSRISAYVLRSMATERESKRTIEFKDKKLDSRLSQRRISLSN